MPGGIGHNDPAASTANSSFLNGPLNVSNMSNSFVAGGNNGPVSSNFTSFSKTSVSKNAVGGGIGGVGLGF